MVPRHQYPLNILTAGGVVSGPGLHPSPKKDHHHDPHHVAPYLSPSGHPSLSPYSKMGPSNPPLHSPKGQQQQSSKLYYECRLCGMRYDTEQKLHFHRQAHVDVRPRPSSISEYPADMPTPGSSGSSVPPDLLSCQECQETFTSDDEYRRHLLVHMLKCCRCGIVLDNEANFVRHLQTQHNEAPLYVCYLCDKQVSSVQQLSRHLLSHPDELNFMCKECNKGFAWKFQLKQHIAQHNSRPYTCKECGKKFAHKTHLRRHEVVHSGVKPHQCKVCQQSFSRKSSLSRHYFIHTPEKPFVCPVCDKGFNRKGRLKNHLNIHIREGLLHLADYVIERRPITREFIEQMNQVKSDDTTPGGAPYEDMSGYTMSDVRQRGPSFVVKSEPHDYEMKDHSATYHHHGSSHHKDESEESSCSDTDDGDIDENEADMSEEITYDHPPTTAQSATIVTPSASETPLTVGHDGKEARRESGVSGAYYSDGVKAFERLHPRPHSCLLYTSPSPRDS